MFSLLDLLTFYKLQSKMKFNNVHSKVQSILFHFLNINEYQLKETEIPIYSTFYILVCLYAALFFI